MAFTQVCACVLHPNGIGGSCGLRHLVLYLCVFGFSLAQAVPALGQDEELDTITVLAEPEPQTGDVQHEEHAGIHQRIGKKELQRHDVNLGDILANETGVQFRQLGGLGTLTSVTMRGASSAQTGVFLDGIMLNSAGNSSVDFSLLELLNLSSVDVYSGSTPAQLSNAGIGGAVNLRSLSVGETKPSNSASITAGSFGTNRFQYAHQSSHSRWDLVAAASREQSNNRFTLDNDNATPLNPTDDRLEKRNNAQVTKLSALSRVGFQWNNNTRTDALLQATGRDLGVPEWLNNEQNEASYNTDLLQFHVVNRFDNIGNWNTSLSLFQHNQNNHYLDALSQVGLGAQDTHSNTHTTGVKTYWERIDESGTFSFSTSLRNESLKSEDALSSGQNYTAERKSLLSNVQYALFALDERLLFTPSMRLQSVSDQYNGISRLDDNRRYDTKVNTQLGVRYKTNEHFTWRANVGKFVREPAFSELFGSRGLIVGNSKLLPESGTNADLGFTYTPSPNYKLNASAFGSWRDELIALLFDARNIGQSVNIGKANVFGIEIDSNWAINHQLSLRFNTTYQRSKNFSPNPALANKEIPGEARLSSHAKLQYQNGRTRVWFESNHKSDFYYDQANLRPGKGYLLHNAGIEYQWREFSIGLTANNTGDDNVKDYRGFPRPGRSYYVSFNYRL